MKRYSLLAPAMALVVAAACNPMGGSGTLTARWMTPVDTASLTMPVTGTWCVGPGRLDLRAAVGDTGLGLAVFPLDSIALTGTYPVLQPGGQIQVRPGAAVALRWMSKVVVQGWWGDSGSVTLAGESIRGLSGNGTVWLVSGLGPDSVTALEFSFRGVRVRSDTLCDAPVLPVAIPLDTTGTLTDPGVN